MKNSVLLDTSFFIRLLNDEGPLHKNARGYYRYFLENDIVLKMSTISVAEYCVLGKLTELPLINIHLVPFNLDHAERTGEFAKILFESNKKSREKLMLRAIIPNDSKLFAQADLDKSVQYFVTSDARSQATYKSLNEILRPKFRIIDIAEPYGYFFGALNLW